MPHQNHVLLLRHCVRSTGSKIKVCDVADDAVEHHRYANFTEYIKAPLPKWDVPEKWCTERGMEIIEDLGSYIIRHLIHGAATDNDANAAAHRNKVTVNIVSDTTHRNVDTSLALLRSIKRSLVANRGTSISGLDQMNINHEVFGHLSSTMMCPSTISLDKEWTAQVSNKFSTLLPPSDFHVQDAIDLVVRLGGMDESAMQHLANDNITCTGETNASLKLMRYIAEMALYSRASGVTPPFLPLASDEDVYRMLNVADYIRSVEKLDNVVSAKRGLIFAKSFLNALLLHGSADNHRWRLRSSSRETRATTITIFVGHESTIQGFATALGIRWTAPPPYIYGADNQIGKFTTIPPGSGIIFSSFPDDAHDATRTTNDGDEYQMSFIVPTDLIDANNTHNGTTTVVHHQLVPIYTIDKTQPELAIREDANASDNKGKISTNQFQKRLESTMVQYPHLRPCFTNAPIVVSGLNIVDSHSKTALSSSSSIAVLSIILVGMIIVNGIGIVALFGTRVSAAWRQRLERKYAQVVRSDVRPELELA